MGLFDRLASARPTPDTDLVELLEEGQAARERGHPTRALHLFGALIERAHAKGDLAMEAAGLQQRGVTWDLSGESERAEADVRSAIALNRRLASPEGPRVLRQDFHALGVILTGRGAHQDALTAFTESARWAAQAGEFENADKASINVALMHHALGDKARALELLEDTVTSDGPRTVTAAVHLTLLVEWLLLARRIDDAVAVANEGLVRAGYWSAKHGMGRLADEALGAVIEAAADSQLHLARVLNAHGRAADAQQSLDAVLRWADQLGVGGVNEAVAKVRRELGPVA